jgi:hypothetical protein
MSYQKGEIYFVRELDRKTGTHTEFVKIGLVRYKEGRDSFNRLLEHQTGNPRPLGLKREEIVVTDAVDLVEAQMHRLFADQRVSGEWFEFANELEIQKAVTKARELKDEVEKLVPLFEQAEKLKNLESTEPMKAATEEDLALALELAIAKDCVKVCDDFINNIKQKLVAKVDAGGEVSDVADTVVKTYKPKFLEADFKAAYPELWKKYVEETKKWQNSFLNKVKVKEVASLGEYFNASIAQISEAIGKFASHADALLLNEPQLALLKLKGEASWNLAISEAKLKIRVGTAEGIEGVCTWRRYWNVGEAFNSEGFAAENPELAKQFVSLPETKTYVQPKKNKA